MRVKTISVTYERKFNLGDYNSAKIGCQLWADLEEGQDEAGAVRLLQDQARDAVKTEYERLARR